MVSDIDDDFFDEIEPDNNSSADGTNTESNSPANKRAQEQAQKNLLARKRIDELKEKKRLKSLLDDSEDW